MRELLPSLSTRQLTKSTSVTMHSKWICLTFQGTVVTACPARFNIKDPVFCLHDVLTCSVLSLKLTHIFPYTALTG